MAGRTFRTRDLGPRPHDRPALRPTHARHAPGGWGIIWPMAKPSPATQTDREVLAGFVERVTFHSAETGSCVLRVKARASRPHHNCRHAAGNAKARPDTTTRRVRGDGYYDSDAASSIANIIRRFRDRAFARSSGLEVRATITASVNWAGRHRPNFIAFGKSLGSAGCAVVTFTSFKARLTFSGLCARTTTETSFQRTTARPSSFNARATDAETSPPANNHAVTWSNSPDTSGSE